MATTARLLLVSACAFLGASACSAGAREYPFKGQIIAVKRDTHQLTVKHEDIPGLMPAMVMSFELADRGQLDRLSEGELITATLVVRDYESELKDIKVVGRAPVEPAIVRSSTVPVLQVGDQVPDSTFIDQDGRTRKLSEWRGKVALVTFIYTRCPLPEFCPRLERNFLDVQKAMRAEPSLGGASLIAVSFDPKHDTPEVLRAHAAKVGADPAVWRYVTGEVEALETFASRFGVSVIRNPADERDITHNLRTAVLDRNQRVTEIFSGGEWKPAEAVAAMKDAAAKR